MATVNAFKPVRPPSAIPVAFSIYVFNAVLPKIALAIVPIESAASARFKPGILPFLSTKFAFLDSPINVASVSNNSTMVKENTTEKMP